MADLSLPMRIQRQRTKGWRMPEGAVYVGRPSEWGNPARAGDIGPDGPMSQDELVDEYRLHARMLAHAHPEWLEPLRGRMLVCWCPLTYTDGCDYPCHADVLLELANPALVLVDRRAGE